MTSFLEHPRGAADGRPGDRSAFFFETLTQLPDSADGKRLWRPPLRPHRHHPHAARRHPHTGLRAGTATQAAMKAVLPETMRELGAMSAVQRVSSVRAPWPGCARRGRRTRAIHELGNGSTFTDSGGFQVLSLGAGFKKTLAMDVTGMKSDDVIAAGKERLAFVDEDGVTFKSPLNGDRQPLPAEISMGIQHKIGADIMFAFDELTTLMNTRSYQEASVERTYRWAQVSELAQHQRLNRGAAANRTRHCTAWCRARTMRTCAGMRPSRSPRWTSTVWASAARSRSVSSQTRARGSATRCRKAGHGTCWASPRSTTSSHVWRMAATRSIALHPRGARATGRFSRATGATTSSVPSTSSISARLRRGATATRASITRAHMWTTCCAPANSMGSRWRRSTTNVSS